MRSCPQCSRRAADTDRFCRDCYTVFPFDQMKAGAAKPKRGRAWKSVVLVAAAVTGAWFYQLDVDPWSQEPGSFEASASAMKRRALIQFSGAADSVLTIVGAGRDITVPASRTVNVSEVTRSEKGCAVRQTLHNARPEPVSPLVLKFDFADAAGAVVGEPATATLDTLLPAGATREFEFEVPCPREFAKVEVASFQDGINFGETIAGSSARFGSWVLQGDPGLSCSRKKPCEVKVRFGSGEVATYLIESRKGSSILIALDDEAGNMLAKAKEATLLLPADEGVRRMTIVKNDGVWSLSTPFVAADIRHRGRPGSTSSKNAELLS